jgi:asparagine synthase (glutamine-hydrolysing)
MCGICGFHNITNGRQATSILSQMVGSLAHRGPDGQGIWLSEDRATGLANTRLAIIDIDGGKQPIRSADGRLLIVFNGELYNFMALRLQLEALGHKLLTKSDTEIVLVAYGQWGHGCLERLRGMFAFAIYDNAKRELFLARDRTGIKPLYYYSGPSGFYFGSELKACLCVPDVPRRVNYQALSDFFVLGYPLLPKTFFAEIYELEPGTWLAVSSDRLAKGRYWRWSRQPSQWNEYRALEESETAIVDSLRDHLVSDVPIGGFLSGGIDSSLLAALLVKVLSKRMQVFTVAFTESEYDESPYARAVAVHLGIPHTQIVLDPKNAGASLLDDVLLQFDQPFGDSSAIPTYMICREIRKSVKVAIGGDGGDEMFGGYRRFWYADMAQRLSHLPNFCLKLSSNILKQFTNVAPETYRKSQKFLRALGARGDRRLVELSSYVFAEKLVDVLEPAALKEIGSYSPSFVPNGHMLTNVGGGEFTDSTIWFALPGDYLRKIDVMSSAHGLEVRVPFLGEHVLTCSSQIPDCLKYSWHQNKIILRKLAAKYLPKEIVTKPKWGFGIPLDSWLGKNGRDEIRASLDSPRARIAQFVRRDYTANLLSSFADQKPDLSTRSRINTYQQVYYLRALEIWLTRWNPAL